MFSAPFNVTRTRDVHKIILAQSRAHPCCIRPRESKIELRTEIEPMMPVYKKMRGAVISSERAYPNWFPILTVYCSTARASPIDEPEHKRHQPFFEAGVPGQLLKQFDGVR